MRKIILVLIIVVVIFVAFNLIKGKDKNTQTEGLQNISVGLSWIPSASFVGDAVAAERFDEKNGLNLSVSFGGPGINTMQMVQTGQNDFGYLASDEVLSAIDKGADLVILGVVTDNSPAGYVSFSDKNINSPKDFEDKSVGVLPFGNTTMIYESMLRTNNVDRSKISETIISYDMKPFLSGAYDIHPIFVYDESVNLDREGVSYNLIKPEDFGVSMKGAVYFAKRETLENNPQMVESFVKMMAEAWNYSVKNERQAINALKELAPEIDEEREAEVLKRAIPYFTAYQNQPLNSDIASWDQTIDNLKKSGVVNQNANFDSAFNFSFINSFYN